MRTVKELIFPRDTDCKCPKCEESQQDFPHESALSEAGTNYRCESCGYNFHVKLDFLYSTSAYVTKLDLIPELIYISLPISGLDEKEVRVTADFHKKYWQRFFGKYNPLGYHVFTPFDVPTFNTKLVSDSDLWLYYMLHDIQAIIHSSKIIVLPNWQNSYGCISEIFVAKKLGKDIKLAHETIEKNNDFCLEDFEDTIFSTQFDLILQTGEIPEKCVINPKSIMKYFQYFHNKELPNLFSKNFLFKHLGINV